VVSLVPIIISRGHHIRNGDSETFNLGEQVNSPYILFNREIDALLDVLCVCCALKKIKINNECRTAHYTSGLRLLLINRIITGILPTILRRDAFTRNRQQREVHGTWKALVGREGEPSMTQPPPPLILRNEDTLRTGPHPREGLLPGQSNLRSVGVQHVRARL
jgi:hypothetical protein